MAETLRMAVAVIGNVASVSLYAAPIVTFKRVIRKKSTEEFSYVPYIIALLNSLLYTWYGLPVVSYKWENFPLVPVNGVGIILELSYVVIYFWYSSSKGKKKVIQTKSVEFMPLPLSLCSFLASLLWLTYGLLIRDIFVAGPNVIGTPLGILQLVLHCKYWKREVIIEEPNKVDLVHKGISLENLDLEKSGLEKGDLEKNVTSS
ncbi:hypothetical protein KIW84_061105 [Lathyrus oleraceus]|uniref:Bidirectional sugar transporter SWEET n=1 Tax=Pisum sativum TaxID=3888 RepID=A0A9D4W4H9_PEA|nr:hypothetical protein KIW84_061105 [Pisum sativum]